MGEQVDPPLPRSAGFVLVGAIFVLAICALVYELIAGTLSSYLLGDSITQFSLVIGMFLSAMGVGSFLSKTVRGDLILVFILIEALVGLIGGSAALVGFAAFAYTEACQPTLLTLVAVVGVLVGLEIPLVIRILRQQATLRVTLANVLSADYLGALAASLLFPFLLLPELGLVRAGLVTGMMNVGVALLLYRWFRRSIGPRLAAVRVVLVVSSILLVGAFVVSTRLVHWFEGNAYQDEVIFAKDSAYQRIVISRWHEDLRLYLNGHLQFSSVDEYRYHECLVHPAMAAAHHRADVLILGGGDGLALARILQYKDVEHVDLVDLDPAVTDLFTNNPMLAALNGHAMSDPRVRVINQDAFSFLSSGAKKYDVILADMPDPSRAELGKLYSKTFYGLVLRRLSAEGAFATQATSPFRSRQAFWCIVHTMAAAGRSSDSAIDAGAPEGSADVAWQVRPYHTYIPTFGTWGFVLATRQPTDLNHLDIPVATRYLSAEVLPRLFAIPPDIGEVNTSVSTLDDPAVWRAYDRGYHKYLD